jgi:hypothetical protein
MSRPWAILPGHALHRPPVRREDAGLPRFAIVVEFDIES